MSSFSVGAIGPESLPLTYTIENDTNLDRTEVVGIMSLFPDDGNAVSEAELADYHFYLDGGRETIGFGIGTSFSTNYQFQTTLPWVPALNAVTATSGNILPGSVEITLYYAGYNPFPTFKEGKVTFADTPINGTTGQWVHPAVASSSINYTTGVVSVTFNSSYAPTGGKPIRLRYRFANPVKYPTQWTVLRTWPSGKVRQAKAWIGQSSGVGMLISKRIQTITTTPASTQTPEYTRAYLRVGKDPAVNALLPTYTVHASLATALNPVGSSVSSQVFDSNNCDYYAGLLAGQAYEEYAVEDPARNSGKGWMKVFQRRNYHTIGASGATFGSLTRDFLSVTSYLYVPHNQRHMEMEVRLGNDYQGADPYEHTFTESLGTGTGFQTAFSATMTNVFPSSDGAHGNIRRGRVKIYRGSTLVAADKMGNGSLTAEGGSGVTGTVNYSTGVVSVNFAAPPLNGDAVTCSYKSFYVKVGNATGVQTLTMTLENKPSQYGVHIRVGGGATSIYEGWDGGGTFGAGTGQIVPYSFVTTPPTQIAAAPLTTTVTGTLATNLVPGTVGFFADTTDAGITSTWFCRDSGTGTLAGRNVSSGTIDYVTGAFSITFSSTPTNTFNLYATYGRTTVARPISGSINYTTRALSVTTSQSVPASTPVFVSYIRNNLASKTHDPNLHPLGSVGLNKWVMLWDGTKFTDLTCEGGPAYYTFTGGTTTKFATILSNGSVPAGGKEPSLHEHLHDGSSVSRLFFLYAGTGATTAEDNTWAAKKIHTINTIPTLDAYNSTRAYGLLEGALRILTPEQYGANFETPRRAYSEDLGRNADPAVYPNKSSQFSCVQAWGNGTPLGAGIGPAYPRNGARGHLGWRENVFEGVNSGGAQRALHDVSTYFLYPQAWQGVRYLYHAAQFAVVRPGTTFWNLAGRSKWDDRAYHNYIPTSPSAGMCIGGSARFGPYTYDSQEFLGRGWRHGYGVGDVSVTNNSTRVEFSGFAGSSDTSLLYNWSSADPNTGTGGAFFTPTATTIVAGRRRIAIQGSIRTYTLNNVVFDTAVNKWVGTLDSPFRGPTASAVSYGLFTDPRTGQDIVDQRNDPRSFPQVRLACGRFAYQHGIEGDSSSHQSSWAAFDAWGATGSWALWDIARHVAEWNMVSVKEFKNGGFYQDQMRTNAWTHRAVVTAYTLTKDLSSRAGFEFLADPVYGQAGSRYAEWMRIRWTQWLDYGARGEMDPQGTIATGGKAKIRDIRITSSSDKADWYSMARIGSPNPAYGGGGTLVGSTWTGRTEAQVRFDDLGFDYVSVWEVGYLMPWMAAAYRELRQDPTVVKLPIRGEADAPFSSIIQRIFDAYCGFAVDYAYLVGQSNVTERGAPGFIAVSVPGNADPRLSTGGGNWATRWGSNVSTSVGTPINFITNPLNASAVRGYYDSITWPTTSINYVAQQVYWLRAAARSFSETRENIDRLGHPLPGRGGFTSFEGGWLDPGLPFQGNPMIPAGATNPVDAANDVWPIVRAPLRGETFNMVGRTWSSSENLLWSTAPFLMQVAKFATDPARRATAGDILNRVLWQTRAISLIKGVYDNPATNEYNQGDALETNYFAGPITGDFPYSVTAGGQPIDRWWNQGYVNRRKITSGTSHTAHIANLDVFRIDLTSYSIPAKLLQQDGSDVRVVRQTSDGLNQVCKSTVRRSATGTWLLFVIPPADVAATQAIPAASTTEAWYIYYGNLSSGTAVWDNTNSADGPFAPDTTTRVLWNQNGNFSTDASTNNWPLSTFSLLEPDYVDGIFGGAVSVNRNNMDVAFSSDATALAKVESAQYLGSAFTFDFYFNVPPQNYELDRSGNYGIFSLADTGVFPMICYLEGPTNRLIYSCSLGGTVSGYSIASLSATGPTRQVIGTGNGSLTTFSANLGANRTRGSVSVVLGSGNGSVYAQDTGLGTLSTGNGIASSTINYSTGDITVTFSAAPANAVPVVAYSTSGSDKWSTGTWNHVRVAYNGSRLLLVVNGTISGTVSISGNLQPIPLNTGTGMSLGAFFAPNTGFTAQSVLKLAEFRVSSIDRGSPAKVTTPLAITLLGEESTVVARTSTASVVSSYIAPLKTVTAQATGFVALARGDAVTAQADMMVLMGANIPASASVALAIAATSQVPAACAGLVGSASVSSSAPATGTLAGYLTFSTTGAGTVVNSGSASAAVTMHVIAGGLSLSPVGMALVTAATPAQAAATCSLTLLDVQASPQPVVGSLQVGRTCFSQVEGTLLGVAAAVRDAVGSIALDLSGSLVAQVRGSVQTSPSILAPSVGIVAGPAGSQAVGGVVGQLALEQSAVAGVIMNVYAGGGLSSVPVQVLGSVQVAAQAVQGATLTVGNPRVYQSDFVLGSILTSSSTLTAANLSVQLLNTSVFLLGSCSILTGGNIQSAVAGMLALASEATAPSLVSVQTAGSAQSAVIGYLDAEDLNVVSPATCSIQYPSVLSVSAAMGGLVVLPGVVENPVVVNFSDLWVVEAACEGFVFASTNQTYTTCLGTVAVRFSGSLATGVTTVAQERRKTAVVRGQVVAAQRLTATSISTTVPRAES